MATGIIVIDKPADWTSQDVTARLRRVFGTRRIGHGGTLDPMATGVLPVFVGRATRAVEFFESAEKEYLATLRLGEITDTEDSTGTVLERRPVTAGPDELRAVLPRFLGEQLQIPPMYSAVKIGGQKLYALARKGQTVERPPRKITIHTLELLESRGTEHVLRVRCSKGTYIRTLCRDLGEALGCGGCMAALRRTRAGCFSLDHAIPLARLLEESEAGQAVGRYLLPVDELFHDLPRITVDDKNAARLRNGAQIRLSHADGQIRVYDRSGNFLLLGYVREQTLTTIKSFFEVNNLD